MTNHGLVAMPISPMPLLVGEPERRSPWRARCSQAMPEMYRAARHAVPMGRGEEHEADDFDTAG